MFKTIPKTKYKHSLSIEDIEKSRAELEWAPALSLISQLSDEFRLLVSAKEKTPGHYFRREMARRMSEISSALFEKPLRIQRYSSLMWKRIASNYADLFGGERSSQTMEMESIKAIADWCDRFKYGIEFRDVKICQAAIVNLMFITETGLVPREVGLQKNRWSKPYLIEFKKAILSLIDSWPSISGYDELDDFGTKWKETAESKRDPYILFMVIYLRTYRKPFGIYYQKAIKNDTSSYIEYLKNMKVVKESMIDYADSLLANDLEKQYSCSIKLATLGQSIAGIRENSIIRNL